MASEAREWKQLNNIPEESLYIEFPLAFTGKTKDGKATVFTNLPLSAQYILAEIYTMNKVCRNYAKLTYDNFMQVFGMSRETVRNALKLLKHLKIIEEVKQSHYKIKAKFDRKDYVTIDRYWLKHEWEVNGENKRLARSRILVLALLERGAMNPKTGGEFISSQARIGVAVNLPRTTAGDCVRELTKAGAIQTEKQNGNGKSKRGCSKYFVNPQILAVIHQTMSWRAWQALLSIEPSAEDLHKRLMLDDEYKDINDRISINQSEIITELRRNRGNDSVKLTELEADKTLLAEELERYFKAHKIDRAIFPLGFFLTDIVESEAN